QVHLAQEQGGDGLVGSSEMMAARKRCGLAEILAEIGAESVVLLQAIDAEEAAARELPHLRQDRTFVSASDQPIGEVELERGHVARTDQSDELDACEEIR